MFRHKIERIGDDGRTQHFYEVAENERDEAFEDLSVCIDRHNFAIEWDLIIEPIESLLIMQ